MRKPTTKTVKVIRAFCTWHPDFWQDDNGDYGVLPTGKWVVEWTIKEHHNITWWHYKAECKNKEQAYEVLKKIQDFGNEFSPWQHACLKDDIFTLGELVSFVECGKRILPKQTNASFV